MILDNDILNIELLCIGYNAGTRKEKVLLPPLTLTVRRGEMVALLGPNGIGKSTLLRTIARLHPRISGEIKLSNRKLENYMNTELARKISFVFTGSVNVYNMSVFEIV
jgi:iron complex transport system ATP-binding protein